MEVVLEDKKHISPFEKRIHEIDLFRGFLIFFVVMDHLFLELYHLYNHENAITFFKLYYFSDLRYFLQPFVLFCFCFVSGISCVFSRNNWKRAIECLILWAIIAVESNVCQLLQDNNIIPMFEPNFRIDINIIGVLGFSMLFYCFIQKYSWKAILAGILIGFLITTYFVPTLRIALSKVCGAYDFPKHIRPGTDIYYGVTEIGNPKFYMPIFWEPSNQADYVPLFPYVVFFFIGAFFSYFVYKPRKTSLFKHKFNWERPICFIGRHTLLIYIGHTVVLMGIFALIKTII